MVQLVISTAGFIIWTCALGVITVASLPYYNAVVAGIILIAYVFGAPLIDGLPGTW